ncbi:VOC family protein [Actinomadura citrea]|uniref:Catechol 2,3-dioxygenase-like lactoylglutathione lyase family enzyme n=1 Tax=Actinomadura citrea TaxID=46158 RepID=A0A7Y9GJ84_9ACTN|nr:VOC family protein [Actinomadura citrea]NYE17506.1 catechol 2,3-dioxygenase-like lactoylglutathione lyase family enzyme [Actinomadura citrea]GGU01336.1 glyoxalase [Actinomadura citrea]
MSRLTLSAPVLDAPDPHALADFYRRLLDWTVVQDEPDWVKLRPPGGGTGLSFQTEPLYRPPTWPAAEGAQLQMAHLDFEVDDLDAAAKHAEAVGAVLADFQPEDDVRVFLDPVGHPFCLFLAEPETPIG